MLRFALYILLFFAFCLSEGAPAYAVDSSDKGDPGISVSSTPGTMPVPKGGDPGLSVSSRPNPVIKKGDPDLSVSSAPVDPAICRALVKHTPDADVNYQPGVDVHGKPVAPADLPGAPQMQMPQTFTIPLTISLAKVLNLNTSQPPFSQLGPSTEATLGTLTVTGDKVLFNGQPISDTQQDNLAVLCMKPNP